MYFKSLELCNYGPFKDVQKIEFTEDQFVIFIKGEYDNNPQESNQSGKSSFVEAILYLLFGEVRKDTKEIDWIHNGKDQMYVAGRLILEGKEVYVKRGRTSENKPILEIEGIEDKNKKDRDKELQLLIGYNSKDFCNTYFCKQNDMHGFMKCGPTDRKKLLQTWLNLDRWGKYELKAKEKKTEYDRKLGDLEITRSVATMNLQHIKIEWTEDQINEEITKLQSRLAVTNDKLTNLKIELNKVPNPTDLLNSIKDLETKLKTCQSNIQTTEVYKTQLENKIKVAANNSIRVAELYKALTKNSSTVQTELDEVKSKLNYVLPQITLLQSNITEKQTLLNKSCEFTGICPIDNQTCDKGNRIPEFKTNLEKEIGVLNNNLTGFMTAKLFIDTTIQSLTNDLAKFNKIEKEINEVAPNSDPKAYENEVKLLNDNLQLLTTDKDSVLAQLEALNKQVAEFTKHDKKALEIEINRVEIEYLDIQSNINTYTANLGKIAVLNQNKARFEAEIKAVEELITTAKKDYQMWSYITYLLGKEIPAILIENSLQAIEDDANMMLDSMTKGRIKLEFLTTKEVSTKQTNCDVCGSLFGKESRCSTCGYGVKKNKIKDEIDLKITNGSNDVSFYLSSGGGQVLISLALRLALAKLLSAKAKKCELLILDEIFGSLDDVNKAEVSKVVFNNLKSLLGFRQIFVITHCSLNDLYNQKTIKILRINNEFSKIST